MSTPNQNEYLLLFRGNEWPKGLSPEEIENVLNRFRAWFDGLMAEGKCKGGQPLEPAGGKIVSGKKGRVVADGPFAEAKEEIGGYFLLTVATMDEAVAIARQCPSLDYGAVVEVRQVAENCAQRAQLQASRELANAGA